MRIMAQCMAIHGDETLGAGSLAQLRRRHGFLKVLVACALVGPFLAACTPDSPSSAIPRTTRDSAGIQISELGGDPWTSEEWGIVDTTRALRILPDDNEPATLFGRIRDATRLHTGDIVVLDETHHQVRIFDSFGRVRGTGGREGEGPGEYEYPMRVFRAPGDSVFVYDGVGYLDIYSRDAKLGRRFRFAELRVVASELVVGRYSDGSFLMNTRTRTSRPASTGSQITLHNHFYVMSANGVRTTEMGTHDGVRMTTFPILGGTRTEAAVPLFSSADAYAFLSSGYVWCETVMFRCEIWNRSGRLAQIILADPARRRLSESDIHARKELELSRSRNDIRRHVVDAAFASAERPEYHPVLSLLVTDSRDRLWIREHTWPEADSYTWIVIDAECRLLGRTEIPARLRIFEIGDDYILGMEKNADGAEFVVMYPYSITRSTPGE